MKDFDKFNEDIKKAKEYPNVKIVNKSTLDEIKNWSADVAINSINGRKPFRKVHRKMVEIEKGKSIPSYGIYWLTDSLAEKLNEMSDSIDSAVNLYDKLLESLKLKFSSPYPEEIEDIAIKNKIQGQVPQEIEEIRANAKNKKSEE